MPWMICVPATFTEGISNSLIEYMALWEAGCSNDGGGTEELERQV